MIRPASLVVSKIIMISYHSNFSEAVERVPKQLLLIFTGFGVKAANAAINT
jgi:hypothetical protein